MTEPIEQTVGWDRVSAPVLVGCSHGTDSAAGRAAVRSILADLRSARPDLDVREAFVDVQQPAVADVVAGAVAAGAVAEDSVSAGAVSASAPRVAVGADPGSTAVVVPLFLSVGFHVRVDIAAAVADRPAAAAAPLGPDPRLVKILVDRLAEAGAGPTDAIVLAAAGSTDARAAVAVEEIASALRAALLASVGCGPITIGYGAGALPRVPEAVASARTAGAGRVVIASYLLAPGFFHDQLLAAGTDLVTAPLAPDPRLAEIALDRFAAGARELAVSPAGR